MKRRPILNNAEIYILCSSLQPLFFFHRFHILIIDALLYHTVLQSVVASILLMG